LYELEASICEAFKGTDVLLLLQALNPPASPERLQWLAGNAAYGILRLALWVKIDEINRLSSDLSYKPSFSLIFIPDLGNGWAEVIGQSAYYALQTGKKAGVVLILGTMRDRKYWIRLNTTIEHFNLPIDTWKVGNASY
jgi:hypothetical protein